MDRQQYRRYWHLTLTQNKKQNLNVYYNRKKERKKESNCGYFENQKEWKRLFG